MRRLKLPMLITTALIYFAVSGIYASARAAAASLKLVFPTTATTFALPYYVAVKKGWLDALTIEEIYVTGDANATRILISKQADIAIVGTLNVMLAAGQGANIKAINSWQPRIDFHIVAAKDKISSPSQLAGKTFAATGPGGLPDQLVRLLCPKYNIDCNDVKFITVTGGHPALLQSVLVGRADATLVNTVTALRGEATHQTATIEHIADDIPSMSYIYTVVRDEDIADPARAKAFQMFTDAMIRGSRYIMDHPDEAVNILHERIPDIDEPFLAKVIMALNQTRVWGVDGGLSTENLIETIDLLVKSGGLSAPIKPEAVGDLRFVNAALERLGTYQGK